MISDRGPRIGIAAASSSAGARDRRVSPKVRQLRRIAVLCLAAAGLGLCSGCCTFERDWKATQMYAYPSDDISGCWEGTWESHTNGHNGRLRAIITKQGENVYYARFKATYAGVLPFEFEVPMHVTEDGGLHSFQGQADLGWLAGGIYTYSGQASPGDFSANYCAEKDQGVFVMSRIMSCIQCCDETQFSEIQQCVLEEPSTGE